MFGWDLLATIVVLCVYGLAAEERPLNAYIRHYEGLDYDRDLLHSRHTRAKRSTANPHVTLEFKAHGRSFNLRLRRDTTTFTQDVEIVLPKGKGRLPFQPTHIYEGHIWVAGCKSNYSETCLERPHVRVVALDRWSLFTGEAGSYVHGSIIDGTFAGKIYSHRGNYFIERADAHFATPLPFHSIIYAEKDVHEDPFKYRRDSSHGNCGNERARSWMDKVVNSQVPKVPDTKPNIEEENLDEAENEAYHNVYIERQKRSVTDEHKTCTLFMQSDPMLWNRMTHSREEDGLAYSYDRAREEITSLFASHVSGIKKIYEDTTFTTYDESQSYTGISFNVRRVKIMETQTDCLRENEENQTLCNPNIDVSNFLNINSLEQHDDFCLAYMFTYRDFVGGTLGLAWVGSPTRASGGICEKWKEYQENSRRISKSLNTGIVTLINYNSPVPPKVSTLTFAHEVGHNFGSPHDSGDVCTPFSSSVSDPDGNYIMYASATSGDRPNNSHFSSCSKDNITRVLDAVFNSRYGKINCFVARESAFCGNNIVEEDEECDCGYTGDCQDSCCYGRSDTSGVQCTRKAGAQCSPSEGPCCNANCTFVSLDAIDCFADSDCNEVARCNGLGATCPTPTAKANNTVCNGNTQVCISGECLGSICQRISWEQCFLTAPENDADFDKAKLCFVACLDPNAAEPLCVSTGDEDALAKPENRALDDLLQELGQDSIKLPPGAPCNDLRGYCDVFQKCRDVDADGPLARLKKLLFNQETFNDIRKWIIERWWAVLLMGVGLVVLMGLFIKVCAVHTPSSNPNKKAARPLTLRPQHRQQGPPPPYSGPSRGGPPHGKGRGPQGRGPQARGQPRQGRGRSYEMQPQKL